MSEQNNIAIRFKNVCKTYRLYTSSRRRLLGLFFKSVPHKTKHAVVDMNLTVERGEAVAILGRNGAGKSTMRHVPHKRRNLRQRRRQRASGAHKRL